MNVAGIVNRLSTLTALGGALWISSIAPARSVDMSCNGLQHTQLLGLIRQSTVLSNSDRARYQAQADYISSAMDDIRNAAKGVDGMLERTKFDQLKKLFDSAPPQAKQAALDAVKRDEPRLFAAPSQDREAQLELRIAVYQKFLDGNKAVARTYESQLYQNKSYLEDLSRDQKSQVEAHRLERLQMMVRSSIPMEIAQRELVQRTLSDRYVQVAASDRDKQEALRRAATDVPALRTLFAAAGLADRISRGDSSFRPLQSISGQAQGVFDDKVVAEGFDEFGRAASRIASARLQATLDLEQAVKVPAAPDLRRQIMSDPNSPISAGNAKVAGRTLQVFNQTQTASDALVKAVPEPPKVTSSPQPWQTEQSLEQARRWMRNAAEKVNQVVRKQEVTTHE